MLGKTVKKENKKRNYYWYETKNGNFEDFFRENTYYYGGTGSTNNRNNYNWNYSYGNNFNNKNKSKYYEILGVSENITKDELKKVYRELVKEHHPDKFANAPEKEKEYHENKLKDINEAYENIIKDLK